MNAPAMFKTILAFKQRFLAQILNLMDAMNRQNDPLWATDLPQTSDFQLCLEPALMRTSEAESAPQQKQPRNFLLIRRPVHRPGRMHRKVVKPETPPKQAIPFIILFTSFIALAALYVITL